MVIPDSVTYIGEEAFKGCPALDTSCFTDGTLWYNKTSATECEVTCEVAYGDRWSSNDNYKNLSRRVVIPSEVRHKGATYSVTSIGYGAFDGCIRLKSLFIPDSVTSIGSSAFYGCIRLKSLFIPDSVTSIGGHAFYGCTALESIRIPNSVNSIGGSAFYDCSALRSVAIGNSVTSIGEHAFCGCSALKSVHIPDSVTSIGGHAFYGCSALRSVTIGNSVTSIGEEAFADCGALTAVYARPVTPPECKDAFDSDGTYSRTFHPVIDKTLYVPEGAAATYKAVYGWGFRNVKSL